jgi:hypothetical protein
MVIADGGSAVPQNVNRKAIEQAVEEALVTNKAFAASNPSAGQTTAHVKAMARQQNAIIRLLLGELDATD